MTTTYRASGDQLVIPSAAVAYTSGLLYRINGIACVALATYAIGDQALFSTTGVHVLPFATASTATQGEAAYWDSVTNGGELTDDDAFPAVGVFWNTSTGLTAEVKLGGAAVGGSPDSVIAIDDTDSPYTLAEPAGDVVVNADTQAGVITLNLPTAADIEGRKITVKRAGTGVNAITIDPAGAETIDGAATLATLDAQYDVVTLVSDGTNWLVYSSVIA